MTSFDYLDAIDTTLFEMLQTKKSEFEILFSPETSNSDPHWFLDKKAFNKTVKHLNKPGIYTIWGEHGLSPIDEISKLDKSTHTERLRVKPYNFLYVGMSMNLQKRLKKHRNGTRGGNIFAVYVGDRLVLPELICKKEISPIKKGYKKMDHYIAYLVQAYLGFQVIEIDPPGWDRKQLQHYLEVIEDKIKVNKRPKLQFPEAE